MSAENHTPPRAGVSPAGDAAKVVRRLRALEDELGAIYYELVRARQAQTGLTARPTQVAQVELKLALRPPGSPASQGSGLFEQLRAAAEHGADSSACFPLGAVYCHWCRSFECPHSRPTDSRSVFGGYTATGQPRWPQLASLLQERHDPRVEHIFSPRASPIVLVQPGRDLNRELLPIYGKRSSVYPILGQVAVGYLMSPKRGDEIGARAPYCVTFQAVEIANGSSHVLLNVVGRLEDGTSALEGLEEAIDPRLADALVSTRRRLGEAGLTFAGRRRVHERRRRVLDTLGLLAKNLDRIFRQRQRRTWHSEERSLNRVRPTSTALRDAIEARGESIYRDVEERTWIVIGPRSRVHVFNDAGVHITSVVYPGETVRHRTTRGKWLAPRPEEIAAFRRAVDRHAGRPSETEV